MGIFEMTNMINTGQTFVQKKPESVDFVAKCIINCDTFFDIFPCHKLTQILNDTIDCVMHTEWFPIASGPTACTLTFGENIGIGPAPPINTGPMMINGIKYRSEPSAELVEYYNQLTELLVSVLTARGKIN